jgi:hypothetical protein
VEICLAGKTTKRRQNSNSSTPPAHTEHPHSMINRETRRAPAPPDASSQTAWEDANHQKSPLLLLQARQHRITHSTGTVIIARARMGRQKKEGNHFPPIINQYRNQREMKKTGTQIQIPTK